MPLMGFWTPGMSMRVIVFVIAPAYNAGIDCMNPSRKFKENVLVVGFFLLSVAVAVIVVVGVWKGRTSARPLAPAAEQVHH